MTPKAKSDMTFEEAIDSAADSDAPPLQYPHIHEGFRRGFTAGARFILESEQWNTAVEYVKRQHSYSGGDCYCETARDVLKCDGCTTRKILASLEELKKQVMRE